MKSVYFQSERELIYFCELIFRKWHTIHVEWKKSTHWGNELILYQELDEKTVVDCFTALFLQLRLENLLKEKLETVYRFEDDIEMAHIIYLVKQSFHEPSPIFTFTNEVAEAFRNYIHGTATVHFDTMITFCLKRLAVPLERITVFGIDEWKLEEAHQQFIASARDFLKKQTTTTDLLYILQGNFFQFYKKNGKPYSDLELRTAMLHTPLHQIDLDENEWNLAPAIALCPKQIFIYGDYPSESKTVSLTNIFEEKIQFRPLREFPFHYSK